MIITFQQGFHEKGGACFDIDECLRLDFFLYTNRKFVVGIFQQQQKQTSKVDNIFLSLFIFFIDKYIFYSHLKIKMCWRLWLLLLLFGGLFLDYNPDLCITVITSDNILLSFL